ncbi:hypothetical protein F4781DRAFT_250662 [Annulohypoxylon bovei var. microspora]|nr:hypothetical protein F4781DRAFT_250662 [Annulohypoxylon bovei var. microspora]
MDYSPPFLTLTQVNEALKEVADYRRPWYRTDVQPTYKFDEYVPKGKFYNDRNLLNIIAPDDWYFRNGIFHAVSTPNSNEYLFFKRWMLEVARGWWRPASEATLNPEAFAGIYDRGQVNFFRVVRSRVDKQVQYAFWTRIARRRHDEALTFVVPGQGRNVDPLQFRQELLMFSLTGIEAANMNNESSIEVETLARFIRSPAVKASFLEYTEDYLSTHEATSNPRWNMVQPFLANPDLAASRRRAYGEGTPSERENLSKSNWIHEDHALRFIICLYNLGRKQFALASIDSEDALHGWSSYLFSEGSFPDVEDRHWFGFSLLMLLISSWQHNKAHPIFEYDDFLVPALYPRFQPRPFDFPQTEVGEIDLSPQSPWVIEKDYEPPFDLAACRALGYLRPNEDDELFEEESETELGDTGNRLPPYLEVQRPRRPRRKRKEGEGPLTKH